MEYEALVARINELAKKSNECGLSEEEVNERAALREDYLCRIRANFHSQMENTYIIDPVTGKKTKVTPKQ